MRLSYADSVHRRAWIVFAALQFIGISCGFLAEKSDHWGAQIWGISFVGLMPGNVLSALLVERLFWNTGASLQGLSWVRVVVMLMINAILWLFLGYVFKSARKTRRESAAISDKLR
jgi:hypothetical protein